MADTLPAHSPMGASGTHRWFNCSGAVKYARMGESKPSTKYAKEGTRAHEIAANWLTTDIAPLEIDGQTFWAVKRYVDFVKSQITTDTSWSIEETFRLSDIEDDIPMFGTADAVVYNRRFKHLHVIDYKHGVGIAVDAYNNPQLLYYALGVWYRMGRTGVKKIKLTIVQPRAYHPDGNIRSWEFPINELVEFEAELMDAVERVRRQPDTYVAGDWCKWCPAASRCKTFSKYAVNDEVGPMLSLDPNLMTDEEVATALRYAKPIKAWVRAVEDEGWHRAEIGLALPGMKIVSGKKVRVWRSQDEAHSILASLIDEPYITTLKSPAQVEAEIGKDAMVRLDDMIDRVAGRPQMVDIGDPREAIGSPSKIATEGL